MNNSIPIWEERNGEMVCVVDGKVVKRRAKFTLPDGSTMTVLQKYPAKLLKARSFNGRRFKKGDVVTVEYMPNGVLVLGSGISCLKYDAKEGVDFVFA